MENVNNLMFSLINTIMELVLQEKEKLMIPQITSVINTLLAFKNVADIISKADKDDFGDLLPSKSTRELFTANGSMVKILSTFIVEPTIIVSKDLREEEIIDKLLELNIDIFASYYIQAFNVMVNMYDMDSSVAFDVLSSTTPKYSAESHKGHDISQITSLSLEDMDILPITTNTIKHFSGTKISNESDDRKRVAKTSDDKGGILPSVIQKNIDITFKTKNSKGVEFTIEVPVYIKAHIIYTDFKNIKNMIEPSSLDKRFGERLDEFRSGGISLRELVFAGDLIKQYKENKFKDKDSLLDFINARSTSATMRKTLKGAAGFGKYYSMVIVSKEEATILGQSMRGVLTKPKYKERFLEQSKSLMLNIVDRDWSRVSIHTKDITSSSDVSYKALSKRKDTSNSDLSEIFKALVGGRPPVI